MKKVLAGSLVGLTLSLGFVAPSFAAETNTNTLSEVKLQAVDPIERTIYVGERIKLPYKSSYYYAVEDGDENIKLTNTGYLTGVKEGTALVTVREDGRIVYKYEITIIE